MSPANRIHIYVGAPEAVRTILRDGARLIGPPEGATLVGPAGLIPDRREAWASLVDALRIDAPGVVVVAVNR